MSLMAFLLFPEVPIRINISLLVELFRFNLQHFKTVVLSLNKQFFSSTFHLFSIMSKMLFILTLNVHY